MPSSSLLQAQSIIKESQLLRQDDCIDIYINAVFTIQKSDSNSEEYTKQDISHQTDGGEFLALFDVCEMHTVYNNNEIDKQSEDSVKHHEFVFDCSHATINEEGFCNNGILEFSIIYKALQEIERFLTSKYTKDLKVKAHFNIYASEPIRDTAWAFAYLIDNKVPLMGAQWQINDDLLSLVSENNTYLKKYRENWLLCVEYIGIATPILMYFCEEQSYSFDRLFEDIEKKAATQKRIIKKNVKSLCEDNHNNSNILPEVCSQKHTEQETLINYNEENSEKALSDRNWDKTESNLQNQLQQETHVFNLYASYDEYIPVEEEISKNHPYIDKTIPWFCTSPYILNKKKIKDTLILKCIQKIEESINNARRGIIEKSHDYIEQNRLLLKKIGDQAEKNAKVMRDNANKTIAAINNAWNSSVEKANIIIHKDQFKKFVRVTHSIPGIGLLLLSIERAYYANRAIEESDNYADFEYYLGKFFEGPLMSTLGYDKVMKNYIMCLYYKWNASKLKDQFLKEYNECDESNYEEIQRITRKINAFDEISEKYWHLANGSLGDSIHSSLDVLEWIPLYGTGASWANTGFYFLQLLAEKDEQKKKKYQEEFELGMAFGLIPYVKKGVRLVRKTKSLEGIKQAYSNEAKSKYELILQHNDNISAKEEYLNYVKGTQEFGERCGFNIHPKIPKEIKKTEGEINKLKQYKEVDGKDFVDALIRVEDTKVAYKNLFLDYAFQKGEFQNSIYEHFADKTMQELIKYSYSEVSDYNNLEYYNYHENEYNVYR